MTTATMTRRVAKAAAKRIPAQRAARRRAPEPPADERVNVLSDEALACRDLRHAWPRRMEWRHLEEWSDGAIKVGERALTCTGRCGTTRVEQFAFDRSGHPTRLGKPVYRHDKSKPYLIKADPDRPDLVRLQADDFRAELIRRQTT